MKITVVINVENVSLEKVNNEIDELKTISESLINTFNDAESVYELYKKGLHIEVKEDKSPVSNGI